MGWDDYVLDKVIGQGSYGSVHKVRCKQDGQLYCLKKIPVNNQDDHDSVLKEAQLLSSFNHANIIAYKESFLHEKSLCIVTSLCEDGDLFSKIRALSKENKWFTEEEVMDIFLQIAMALEHIHNRKVLHRDLKTQNIFVARGKIIKIGDFGISKILAKTDDFATTVTGTPYYMAPEICTNQPYTYKSDIWSLGCVLYELCTQQHAFAANSLLSLVYQIVRGDFPPIPDRYSPQMAALVNCLLCKQPDRRPTLPQIFKSNYVQAHVQRFHKKVHNTTRKQIRILRRSQSQENETNAGAELPPPAVDDVQLSLKIPPRNLQQEENLTPRERMRRRKETKAAERMMELKQAAVGTVHAQRLARERKDLMLRGELGSPHSADTPGSTSNQGMANGFGQSMTPSQRCPTSSPEDPPTRLGKVDEDDSVLFGSVVPSPGPETGSYVRVPPEPYTPQGDADTRKSLNPRFEDPRVDYQDEGDDIVLMGSVVTPPQYTSPPQHQLEVPTALGYKFGFGREEADTNPPLEDTESSKDVVLLGSVVHNFPASDPEPRPESRGFTAAGFKFGLGSDTAAQDEDDDTVLMGTVVQDPAETPPEPRPASRGFTAAGFKFGFGADEAGDGDPDDTMLMGSVVHQPPEGNHDTQQQSIGQGECGFRFGHSVETTEKDNGHGTGLSGTMEQSASEPAPDATAVSEGVGETTGLDESGGGTVLQGSSLQQENGALFNQEDGASDDHERIDDPNLNDDDGYETEGSVFWDEEQSVHNVLDRSSSHGDCVNGDHLPDPPSSDEGGYSDDFEDYASDFDENDETDDLEVDTMTVAQRIQILENLKDARKSSTHSSTACDVEDNIPLSCKDEMLMKIRDKCRETLGGTFEDVYQYLKTIRARGVQAEETEIMGTLRDITGATEDMLTACFQVDQLIFQEMLYDGM